MNESFFFLFKKIERKAYFYAIGSFISLNLFGWFGSQNTNQQAFVFLLSCLLAYVTYLIFRGNYQEWKLVSDEPFPEKWRYYLKAHVPFYLQLQEKDKRVFEKRVQFFLNEKSVTGVGTSIDDKIRILVASSAIIPVFAFPDYHYENVQEILIYPGTFNTEFETEKFAGHDKNISGMVGRGAMNGIMILSKPDLLRAFANPKDGRNVGIHEFVHLIDMADGSTDGIPELLLQSSYTAPWIKEIQNVVHEIEAGDSRIRPYALTNNAEFLSVVSEYFFETSKKLKNVHLELYERLSRIFNSKPPKF